MMGNDSGDISLASFEGKYPKVLFNKNVIVNGMAVGHVAKETEDTIVVFGESGDSRYDIPKSKIEVAGGSVIVKEALNLYAINKDAPLPEGKSLRPSAEEIIQKASEIPSKPPLPVEETNPSTVEQKMMDVANEFRGVGWELEHAVKAAEANMRDVGTIAANDAQDATGNAARGFW